MILILAALLLTGCTLTIRETSGKADQTGNTEDDPAGKGNNGDESIQNDSSNNQSAPDQVNEAVPETDVINGSEDTDSTIYDSGDTFEVSNFAADWINSNNSVSIDSITGNWYAGMIGNAKIHAKFDASDYKVTGHYYYDKYKEEILLDGYTDDGIKGMLWMSMTEDTDKKGSIYALFRTDEYAEGFWRSGDTVYPMYLIKEGSDAEPPKPAGDEALAYKGLWYGDGSYYAGGEVTFTPLFSDLVFYDLSSYNGAHSGWLESFGILEDGSLTTVFKDNAYESNDKVVFSFKPKDKMLVLDSNMYEYMCGMGVAFSSEYTREEQDVPVPTAQDVGIVDSEKMEKVFREITGEDFETFISYTTAVDYEDITLDGKPAQAGKSILRGLYGMCIYVVADNRIYAAYTDYDNIYYYTNDKKYAKSLPEPMKEWASNLKAKIHYKYTQTK